LIRSLLACSLLLAHGFALASGFVRIEAADFLSVLPADKDRALTHVASFELQALPVTNADFSQFVRQHPSWKKGSVPKLFADEGYLKHWKNAGDPGVGPQQPVVNVSWFAALAYCEAQGARLPSWHEWEWAAAADEISADARAQPEWRQKILSWYSVPGGTALSPVGQNRADLRGIHDLHGLVWEWVEDYGALMVSGDNREQGDPDLMKFCGTGALSMEQKENYAVLMRIAMLSSLQARNTTANLGFRCARDARQP